MKTTLTFILFLLVVSSVAYGQQKINCTDCASSLLIFVDQPCTLRVDGQNLGALAAGDSKLVRLDLGAHLIEAKSGDVNWESTVRTEKPGQEIVRTTLSSLKAASKWVGEWAGGTSYGSDNVNGNFSYYYELYTFRIGTGGNCSVIKETSFTNDFKRNNESTYDMHQRVMSEARTRNPVTNGYSCQVTPEGQIHSPYGDVTKDGDFTFKQTWANEERVTVRLQRTK